MVRIFALLGAFNMAVGIALGAFAAHALKTQLEANALAVFQTGVQYQIYHALGLLFVAALTHAYPQAKGLRSGGILLAVGIFLFSGSLYLLALTGQKWFGPITPLGGAAFILGWLRIFWAMLKAL